MQQALATALRGRTSLVIAHRLSTVREADLILVLDHGRIVERGRHDELLAAGGSTPSSTASSSSARNPVGPVGPVGRTGRTRRLDRGVPKAAPEQGGPSGGRARRDRLRSGRLADAERRSHPCRGCRPGRGPRSDDHSCCRDAVARSAHSGPTRSETAPNSPLSSLVSCWYMVSFFRCSSWRWPDPLGRGGTPRLPGTRASAAASAGCSTPRGGHHRWVGMARRPVNRVGEGSGQSAGGPERLLTKEKEPLPKKRLLDGSRPCQCLFNPSRVPPELPWRWIRGHPCCTRWRCPQWRRPWTGGPSRPPSGRPPSLAPVLDGLPMSLTVTSVAGRPPRASSSVQRTGFPGIQAPCPL